jgi:multidrug resistance efflux pump
LSTFGEVRARRTLELRAPQAGEVIELSTNFQEGGSVKAGDVLLRVDPTDAESNLRVAQADLQEAEAELTDAERGLNIAEDDLAAARGQLDLRVAALTRQRNLADRGVGTESSVETVALSEASARRQRPASIRVKTVCCEPKSMFQKQSERWPIHRSWPRLMAHCQTCRPRWALFSMPTNK